MTSMRKALSVEAKRAQGDQESLRGVLAQLSTVVGCMSGKVDQLQADVRELALKVDLGISDLSKEIRAGNPALLTAFQQLKTAIDASGDAETAGRVLEGQAAIMTALQEVTQASRGTGTELAQVAAALNAGFLEAREAGDEKTGALLLALEHLSGQVAAIEDRTARVEGIARGQVNRKAEVRLLP